MTGTLLRVPLAGAIILFPRDEVIVRRRHRLGKDLLAENAPVDDAGQHRLGGQPQILAQPRQQRGEALTHVLVVVRTLQIHRIPGGGVKEIRVQNLVRPTDIGAPALEHVLHSRVMLGVGIEIEVAGLGRAHQLPIKAQELWDGRD